ncbi:metallo-beta-lactamase domain protein [Penicillium robsamsonii]|uniref:metallo-beta-lactamase domain protein n=1 Tax=Penicillium robsamsonii TaxID=1792511 RepID=UPI00254802A1|nr:metallo-beta-lactamase domain protein [Penicillium robsamsonii]KAJ5810982.1 metallo-beta-lactamase domain protein [Penicillium robsamsonii]
MQLQGTNTYVIGTGLDRLLIDSGQGRPGWVLLLSSLAKKQSFKICKVLLTHWHLDHTEGVRDLLRMNPELKDAIYKYDPDPCQQPITDGDIFAVEGATVRAVFTPGHSADHVSFLLEEETAIFTGDCLLGHGTTAVENLEQYMQSLLKIRGLNCRIGYPGHGAPIVSLQSRLLGEIDQRQRRERKMLLDLESHEGGSATEAELIEAAFGKKVPEIVRENILAPHVKEILMKMAREKRVGFRSKGGQKHWFINKTH